MVRARFKFEALVICASCIADLDKIRIHFPEGEPWASAVVYF